MDYQVRNLEIEALLRKVGQAIKALMPKGWGFTVLIFDYKQNGSMFYMSSSERTSMIEAMKEFISKNSN